MKLHIAILLSAAVFIPAACSTAPPPRQENACVILKDNKDWYRAMRKSARKWGAPIGLQMAIVKQESSFKHDAKPERGKRRWLGLLPGKRPSSAYGYAQALDGTWAEYQRDTGKSGADRDEFNDAVDFIGWYVNRSGRMAGIRQHDYRAHYLAYHEGPNGFLRGTHRSKAWLVKTANLVHSNASRYENQIQGCKKQLKRRWLF